MFSKPPDMNINWDVWNPLIPRNRNKFVTFLILSVTTFLTIALVVLLLNDPYRTAINDILYSIVHSILTEANLVALKIFSAVVSLLYILVLTVIHEIAHFICYPAFLRKKVYVFWDKTVCGITLFYDGELPRTRRIWLNLTPLIVLSCGMFVLSLIADGNLRYMLQIMAFSNIALSSADIVGVFLLLRLPPKAVLYNGIWKQGV